eukprot:31644_1
MTVCLRRALLRGWYNRLAKAERLKRWVRGRCCTRWSRQGRSFRHCGGKHSRWRGRQSPTCQRRGLSGGRGITCSGGKPQRQRRDWLPWCARRGPDRSSHGRQFRAYRRLHAYQFGDDRRLHTKAFYCGRGRDGHGRACGRRPFRRSRCTCWRKYGQLP